MSNQELSTAMDKDLMLNLVSNGDCSKLTPDQKLAYYKARCDAAGLDARTQPFQFVNLGGKMVLYALKAATDQLASKHGVVTEIVSQQTDAGIRTVTVRARTKDGRQTDEIGAVALGQAQGDTLCNLYMKCVTKAKRRAVLSLCGLGMLDEHEIETVPNAKVEPFVMIESSITPPLVAPVVAQPTAQTGGVATATPPPAPTNGNGGKRLGRPPGIPNKPKVYVVPPVLTPPPDDAGDRVPDSVTDSAQPDVEILGPPNPESPLVKKQEQEALAAFADFPVGSVITLKKKTCVCGSSEYRVHEGGPNTKNPGRKYVKCAKGCSEVNVDWHNFWLKDVMKNEMQG